MLDPRQTERPRTEIALRRDIDDASVFFDVADNVILRFGTDCADEDNFGLG